MPDLLIQRSRQEDHAGRAVVIDDPWGVEVKDGGRRMTSDFLYVEAPCKQIFLRIQARKTIESFLIQSFWSAFIHQVFSTYLSLDAIPGFSESHLFIYFTWCPGDLVVFWDLILWTKLESQEILGASWNGCLILLILLNPWNFKDPLRQIPCEVRRSDPPKKRDD